MTIRGDSEDYGESGALWIYTVSRVGGEDVR